MGETRIHLIGHSVQKEKEGNKDGRSVGTKNFSIKSKDKLHGEEGWRELGM